MSILYDLLGESPKSKPWVQVLLSHGGRRVWRDVGGRASSHAFKKEAQTLYLWSRLAGTGLEGRVGKGFIAAVMLHCVAALRGPDSVADHGRFW